MDFLKQAASEFSGSKQSTAHTDNSTITAANGQQGTTELGQTANGQQGGSNPTSNQQKDYGDKAFDFISKKAGKDFDDQTDEKITDAARGMYEKFSGSKVDAKYSN